MECFDHSNLARSYDKVCHARLADTKCLCKLLLGKRKSKLNLRCRLIGIVLSFGILLEIIILHNKDQQYL